MTQKQPNAIFDHNPPVDERFIDQLFCNRDAELEQGLDCLRAPVATGKICAIYGMPRSGKSHFALRLLSRAREAGLPYLIVKINANTRGTAKAVLEETFFKLMSLIRGVPREQVPEGQSSVLEEYLGHLEQYEDVVGRESVEFTIERSEAISRVQEAGLKLAVRPFDISVAQKQEARESSSDKLVQRSLTGRELAEILRYALDVIAWLYPERQILIFVDDLDLVDRKGREGQPESELLIDYLRLLAEPPTLAERTPTMVLATIRDTSFTDRDKDFRDFVEVRLLEPEQHLAIYRRHIELFNAGEEIFKSSTVAWLEQCSGGQVGMFLRRCRELWGHFNKRLPAGTLINEEHVKGYVKKNVRDLMRNLDTFPVMAEVQAAVRAGQTEVEIAGDGAARAGLVFRVLTPIDKGGKYRINAMYYDAIKEMVADGGMG